MNEAAFELAQRLAERERHAGVARIQARVRRETPVRFICSCGEEISEARRRAAPHSDKCIDCATFAERHQRRRA